MWKEAKDGGQCPLDITKAGSCMCVRSGGSVWIAKEEGTESCCWDAMVVGIVWVENKDADGWVKSPEATDANRCKLVDWEGKDWSDFGRLELEWGKRRFIRIQSSEKRKFSEAVKRRTKKRKTSKTATRRNPEIGKRWLSVRSGAWSTLEANGRITAKRKVLKGTSCSGCQ